MADRSVKKPDDPDNIRDIVELDKDDRWQARLEEARARREIVLREKAAAPAKKRPKPWEEHGEEDTDDFTIKPIIQAKPDDEEGLDFADRLEVIRETAEADTPDDTSDTDVEPKPEPASKPKVRPKLASAPELAAPIVSAVPSLAPTPLPKKPKPDNPSDHRQNVTPRIHDYDQMGAPDGATGRPEDYHARPRRDTGLVANDAPDVIDLAQRYAATLKPPNNVTVPFDTSRRTHQAPKQPAAAPDPYVVAPRQPVRSRRPFGLAIVVLAFSLVPLSQLAPPLEKGPAVPPTPFFGLPPALGLPTSWVWLPEDRSEIWVRPMPGPVLGAAPTAETSSISTATSLPNLGGIDLGALVGTVDWTALDAVPIADQPAPIAEASSADDPIILIPRLAPRPRPTTQTPAPQLDAEPEAGAETVQNRTVVDLSIGGRSPDALAPAVPDARPLNRDTVPEPLASTLSLTILVPNRAALATAEEIAARAEARGHPPSVIRNVDVSINTPNVRYFHNDDRIEATRLARDYGVEVRDFTWFRPQPELGKAEFWLSGEVRSNRPRPTVATPDRAEVLTPEVPPRTFTLVRRRPTLLERLLTGSDGEIEIILPDPNGIFSGNPEGAVDEN